MRKRTAICLSVLALLIGAITVDHHFRSAAKQNPLFAPVTVSETASSQAKADFKAGVIAASKIQCKLEGVSFVAIPNTSDIQVLGLENGKLYSIAGQLTSFKRDVLESKLTTFDLNKPCSIMNLGADAKVIDGQWTNTGTTSVVVFNQFGVAQRFIQSGASDKIAIGETGRFVY